jgi:hypothetical protein
MWQPEGAVRRFKTALYIYIAYVTRMDIILLDRYIALFAVMGSLVQHKNRKETAQRRNSTQHNTAQHNTTQLKTIQKHRIYKIVNKNKKQT